MSKQNILYAYKFIAEHQLLQTFYRLKFIKYVFKHIFPHPLYLTETQHNDNDVKNNHRIKQTAIEERFLTHNKHCEGACGYRHAPSQYVSWMRYSPHLFGCHTEPSRKCWMGRS